MHKLKNYLTRRAFSEYLGVFFYCIFFYSPNLLVRACLMFLRPTQKCTLLQIQRPIRRDTNTASYQQEMNKNILAPHYGKIYTTFAVGIGIPSRPFVHISIFLKTCL